MKIYIILHLDKFHYVHVMDEYPQDMHVGMYCPSKHYKYRSHVCGNGASEWRGSGKVESGPFSTNVILSPGDHCYEDCDCREITVECILTSGTTR